MKLTETHKKIILVVAALFGIVVAINVSEAPSPSKSKSKWRFSKYPLLWDVILRGEAKTWNDYNFYNSKGLNSRVNAKDTQPFTNKLLTELTIGKVIEYQSMSRSGIGQLWATGQFQIIPVTLKGTYGSAGLNLGSMYNEQNQTKLADALIDMETTLPKYLNGKIADNDVNLKKAALDIATVWSSLGVPYAVTNHRGEYRPYNASYFGSDRASVSTEVVQKILREQRKALSK
jgi:hypothetical protein